MDDARYQAFLEALDRKLDEKLASPWAPALAAGALLGGSQLVSGVSDARREGQSWGDALERGGRSALTWGGLGALAGGGLGLASRRSARARDMSQGITDFGKKTLHALTGFGGVEGLHAAGGGSAATAETLRQARERLSKVPQTGGGWDAASAAVAQAQKGHRAVQDMEQAGLTSLPGLAKGLYRSPGDTLKKVYHGTVGGLSGWEKALMLGTTAAGGALSLTDPDPENPRTPGQRALSLLSNLGMNVATAPLQLSMTSKGVLGGLASQLTAGSAITSALELPVQEAQRALGRSSPANRIVAGGQPAPQSFENYGANQ